MTRHLTEAKKRKILSGEGHLHLWPQRIPTNYFLKDNVKLTEKKHPSTLGNNIL